MFYYCNYANGIKQNGKSRSRATNLTKYLLGNFLHNNCGATLSLLTTRTERLARERFSVVNKSIHRRAWMCTKLNSTKRNQRLSSVILKIMNKFNFFRRRKLAIKFSILFYARNDNKFLQWNRSFQMWYKRVPISRKFSSQLKLLINPTFGVSYS